MLEENKNAPQVIRETYTAKQAAAYIGCSYWKLLEMVKAGQIPCIGIGSRKLFRKASLQLWMDNLESVSQREVNTGIRRV